MKIKIEAKVNGSLENVWNKYTEPEHITKWNFASDDWVCPSAVNDLKVGGKYTARMEAKDGSMGFDFVGHYTDVQDQKKLAYTLEDGRLVEVSFEVVDDAVMVTTVFDAENQNPVEMQEQGWQSILNNFKKYAEN